MFQLGNVLQYAKPLYPSQNFAQNSNMTTKCWYLTLKISYRQNHSACSVMISFNYELLTIPHICFAHSENLIFLRSHVGLLMCILADRVWHTMLKAWVPRQSRIYGFTVNSKPCTSKKTRNPFLCKCRVVTIFEWCAQILGSFECNFRNLRISILGMHHTFCNTNYPKYTQLIICTESFCSFDHFHEFLKLLKAISKS